MGALLASYQAKTHVVKLKCVHQIWTAGALAGIQVDPARNSASGWLSAGEGAGGPDS
ncbi:MAG: hypothetical protein JNL81_00995 [Hyphomonadaceae bacterium]|nr:hypothetical protein [Hyphomonadaceae bacterium]